MVSGDSVDADGDAGAVIITCGYRRDDCKVYKGSFCGWWEFAYRWLVLHLFMYDVQRFMSLVCFVES